MRTSITGYILYKDFPSEGKTLYLFGGDDFICPIDAVTVSNINMAYIGKTREEMEDYKERFFRSEDWKVRHVRILTETTVTDIEEEE